MTAEAPSAVPQSVVDGGTDGGNAPGAFVPVAHGNGHVNGFAPHGVSPVEDVPEPEQTAPADAIEAHVAEADTAGSEVRAPDPRTAEPEPTEDSASDVAEEPVGDTAADVDGNAVGDPAEDTATDLVADATAGSVGDTDQAYEVRDEELAEPAAPAPPGPMATEEVAAEVAEQLSVVVGEEVEADPAEFAAAAVLDVLRAAGWADATEAAELKAEATRLRELLSEVIRDHRAREASAAGGQNQQLYWLVPLLRAAHGVAFGSLGAKVALRTAVQEVPPDVLALAGLRIDYGVEPAYEDN